MKLNLAGIFDRGIPNKERVAITVAYPADLSYYAVLDTQATPQGNQIVAGARQIYWFTPLVAKPGDIVILYSGGGAINSVRRPDGGSNHFFYWGFPKTIWNSPLSRAVLLELATWNTIG